MQVVMQGERQTHTGKWHHECVWFGEELRLCSHGHMFKWQHGGKQFLRLAAANHEPLIPILVLCLQLCQKNCSQLHGELD